MSSLGTGAGSQLSGELRHETAAGRASSILVDGESLGPCLPLEVEPRLATGGTAGLPQNTHGAPSQVSTTPTWKGSAHFPPTAPQDFP